MSKNLVIVESPAKVKTIKKFLGSNYEVMASNGHVRDLPKSSLGVDTEHDFEPKYITIRGKGDLVASLKKEVKKADKIYLATDPDREGEAISWHLYYALKLEGKKVYRITFNEITKGAVKESIKNARDIDMNLVNAQQARRILDRMVGYRISPLLWAKVKRGLSAGRVQSVALRMICEREAEIDAFIPREYWTLDAMLLSGKDKKPIKAHYNGGEDKSDEIGSKEVLDAVIKDIKNADFCVKDVKKGERVRKQPLPFITSTLQQEASKVLNFSTQKTMRIAQQLYEGIDIKGEGTVGIITYLRTDSTRVAAEACTMAEAYIKDSYGDRYVGTNNERKKEGKKIQDAHEAIRPTDINRTPERLKGSLSRDQLRLYTLIWKRFAAAMMSPAVYETTSVKIEAAGHKFVSSASRLAFDGFMRVYSTEEDKDENAGTLPSDITKNSKLKLSDIDEKQHFTQPPAHFTEASLVKAMEELGIGRPSTYAPTITTILARRYVTKEGKNLYVTELGEVVNQMMVEAFPGIVDKDFTANLEMLLDNVEEGTVDWKTIIRNFYPDLDEAVKAAEKELEKVNIADEVTDEVCELCGRNMVLKYGPHGKFLACPGFPECKNTKPYLEKIGIKCPKCGKDIVVRKTKKGRRFYGCESGVDCEFMSWQKPVDVPCEKCGGLMVEKGAKLQCINPECGNVVDKPSVNKKEQQTKMD
ncbi:MAG: type I DNA topoisomerase [Lachnospiraceae bacterium]|nr:type I DNA topoisomerase [Lachnospiraceae bacterium]